MQKRDKLRKIVSGGLILLLAVISLGVVATPMMQKGLNTSTDALFHLARIESIYLALKEGVFPVKVHFASAYTYGYGSGFFYQDLFLYVPALLMFAGLSLQTSYKIFALLMLAVAWMSVRWSINFLLEGRNHTLAVYGASIYVMSNQLTGYLYGSQSLGAYCAMAFIPICVAELLHILYRKGEKKNYLQLLIGTACVVLTHLSTSILTLIFLLLIALLSADRLIANHCQILRRLFITALGGAILTTAFWLPALEQISVQKFRFQTALIYPISENTIPVSEMPAVLGVGMLAVVVVGVAASIWTALQRKKATCLKGACQGNSSDGRMLLTCEVTSLTFLLLTFCEAFWTRFGSFCEFIQFPSRLLTPVIAGMVLVLCGEICQVWSFDASNDNDSSNHVIEKGCAVLALLAVFVLAFGNLKEKLPQYGSDQALGTGLLTEQIAGLGSGEEWLPDGAYRSGLTEPEKSYDPEGGGADGVKHDYGKYYEVYVPMTWEYYDVPYLYYKGYAAYLLDENEEITEELQVGKSDRYAYVRVYIPKGRDGIGHIMVTYRKTMLQKVSYVVSGIAVFLLAFLLARELWENHTTPAKIRETL